MAIPMFLAMTRSEWMQRKDSGTPIGWMACHFSPYSTGLSNRPSSLSAGSMLILNDRTPVNGHDPDVIAAQIEETVIQYSCSHLLLDLQRPDEPQTFAIVKAIAQSCPCPLGITEYYADGIDCAVFLPPVPLNIPAARYLQRYSGRQIWLELSAECLSISVTKDGSRFRNLPLQEAGDAVFQDDELLCHYDTTITADQICFSLHRTPEDQKLLVMEAEKLGVTCVTGLYQQFPDW
jgi:hypothetical protein